uniref:UDP-2,3-diacylglucosamine diphosphatase n=1 Tax=Ningiella ruwaisensis TaxID=2364274 RepID=UPI00109F0B61|nr:UDP-2,3-diacylglucosamine diphosphatase [Ningiella ruwaisensis]
MSSSITFFISDLHLSAQRPDITACFDNFMQNEAPQAEALYILGDLFEVWIGDDDITDFSEHIANTIAQVANKLPVYFIHGNRDFAIREGFAKRCGMQLLPEQAVIDLYGRKTLISHGDELCTRDKAYMKFRKKARGWWWPKLMLALPLSWRRRIAENGRKTSQNNQKVLTADIMDVTPSEVDAAMRRFEVDYFIHGHTHRPNIHRFNLDGRARQRIVLGDWYDQGSILRASPDELSLEVRPF